METMLSTTNRNPINDVNTASADPSSGGASGRRRNEAPIRSSFSEILTVLQGSSLFFSEGTDYESVP